jgi:LytS/YehU family sensor histidine kinase
MLLLFVFFLYQMDTERDLMVKQMELSNNKVSLLMDQIHPHFIYNALQQIALLCDEEPGSVKEAIIAFSGYLRKNLESLTNEGMIPFTEEMEHADIFIELAKILPSKDFVVEKRFEVTDFKIPALVVQPLVENAIKYGIGMSTEGDKILIETKLEGGYIVIRVVDDGHGVRTELSTQKKHKSVGTNNVKTRLKILCDGEMKINRSDSGTEAVIRIPEIKARS